MRRPVPQGSPLTVREMQVLELVAQGLTNKQIGGRLFIDGLTVKTHLAHIGQRLGCGERAGMVAIAYRTGLLRIPDEELLRQANAVVVRAREHRRAVLLGGSMQQRGRKVAA